MDLYTLVTQLNQQGVFARMVNNPLSYMGQPNAPYLGASLLPEQPRVDNVFQEQAIQWRSVIANDAARYSPVQLKQGMLIGSMLVQLADIDIGSELNAQDYDALIRLIEQSQGTQGQPGGGVDRPTMEAMAQLTQWAEMTLNRPLLEKMEKQRWEAIVNAQVVRTGDNGYAETVPFTSPTGHRPNAGGVWSDNTYDPYTDIIAGAEVLASKGYTVNRIITSTPIRSKLSLNAKLQTRFGRIAIAAGVVTGVPGRLTLEDLNNNFGTDGLPPIELYDRQYRTQSSFARFLASNVFCMFATTGRDRSIDRGDVGPLIIPNTIGYQAVGRPAGSNIPQRRVKVTPFDDKPPRIEGQAWSTTFPVITDPEAIFVIKSIT